MFGDLYRLVPRQPFGIAILVPLGASGDEKSPFLAITGDPAGSMSADTHLFQVFFESTLPCLLRPFTLSSGTQ